MENYIEIDDKITFKDAHKALHRFCEGKQKMCIPVNKNDDDNIIADILLAAEHQLKKYKEVSSHHKQHAEELAQESSNDIATIIYLQKMLNGAIKVISHCDGAHWWNTEKTSRDFLNREDVRTYRGKK